MLHRITQVPWLTHSSPTLIDTLHLTAAKVVPSFSRLAILRWHLDTEPDVHFRLRPYLTRRTLCRCGCGIYTSFYPEGLLAGAVAPSHLSPLHSWRVLAPPTSSSPFERFLNSPPHPLLPDALHPTWTPRGKAPTATLDFLSPTLQRLLQCPCVLCNQGDNSVQHWILFCPVTALAGSLLLNRPWTTASWFFSRTSSLSQRSVIAGLWVASRQLCHERSALPPPSLDPPPAYSSNPLALARLLVDRALALIPPPSVPPTCTNPFLLKSPQGVFGISFNFVPLLLKRKAIQTIMGLSLLWLRLSPRTISLLSSRFDLTFPNDCSCSNLQSLPLLTAPSSSAYAPAALSMGTSLQSCLSPHERIGLRFTF